MRTVVGLHAGLDRGRLSQVVHSTTQNPAKTADEGRVNCISTLFHSYVVVLNRLNCVAIF
jgi:hypothetical protein